jgi:hypothetical protein
MLGSYFSNEIVFFHSCKFRFFGKEEYRLTIKTLVKTSEYHDSVSLMLVARELTGLPGVQDAAVVMGTEANKSILEQSGMLSSEAQAATPNDLVIAVQTRAMAMVCWQKLKNCLPKSSRLKRRQSSVQKPSAGQ